MRKLLALAIALFFVFQSTGALATPVESCCIEDCKATACDVAICLACVVAPAAVNCHAAEDVPDHEALVRSGDEAVLPTAAQEVWRPPD